MRKPIKEIEIEGHDEAHTIMQVAQRLPPHYLLDNPVSRPSFVPTVIAALHPSNRLWAPVCPDLLWCSQATSVDGKDLTGLPTC